MNSKSNVDFVNVDSIEIFRESDSESTELIFESSSTEIYSDSDIEESSSSQSANTSSTDIYNESDRDYVGSDVNSVSSQSSASSDHSSQNTSINSVENSISIENQNGLKCLYTNADSISNKWSELEALVYLHQPDIVGLTEAFKKNLENPNLSSYVLQGYHVFCNPKFQNVASRGTLLFVRDYLEVTEYKKLNENSAKEAIWCEIKINNLEKLLVGLVYRSPNSSAENNVAINEMISALNNETQSRVVVMGDFNYRDIDWKHWISSAPENHVSHEFIEAVRDSYLHQNIEFYTRYRNGQRPSTLDLVFSSEELLVNNIEHFSPLGKSDHIVITFGIDCNSSNEAYMKESFTYDRGNYDEMKTDLSNVDWISEFQGKEVNENWIFFKDKITESMKKHIPVKKIKSSNRGYKPIWMTREALKAVKKKHRAWNKYRQTNEHVHFQYFCRQRNIATRECRKARNNFETKIAEDTNPKAFYKYVNSRKKVQNGIADLKRDDGSITENDLEKTEELNRFFKSVFTIEDLNNIPYINDRSSGKSILEVQFNEQITMKLLENLNVTKSCGPDFLHPRVLKEVKNAICLPLTLLFHQSFEEEETPIDWKTANVKALFKKGRETRQETIDQ
ncbi:uncharacterized protein LOC132759227 [Ruditapes philippinarum]|uniref:uncharacterized protein LOC132759227 n=1 Tax=Ruditapes philippinarum TaxID=129788 RepID=UPI00295AC83E|nr:uncharacterized protein LOC132759227 [Ruditapes philippinarum]